ncbi:metallo-beta-lactamase superfamily protein [Chryseobacterium sp. 52]|uniref:MBL fold metallo-hydrolase n=1 Tax=Chryseobacterium sp. 52 TaxID=2035213 RepID=UPI000C17F500|nr:MBL fold metallo-hydrolase [Chryseobacterium sp. 52]PIF45364.1 metallo-beta-lactamase superfamily protein [Chryseobacterium sp. 52]
MKLFCYNAGCGDAFRIEFKGKSGIIRHILLDAGYERTFRNVLSKDLNVIKKQGQNIDLCIATHIHDDHIGGLKSLVNAINTNRADDMILQWWYNPPRITNLKLKSSEVESVAQSISQADVITRYLSTKCVLTKAPIVSSPHPYHLDGMDIYILSPNERSLNKLIDKYRDPKIAIEPIEDDKASQAIATKTRDYHIPVGDFNFQKWKEDRNIENGSSIALLTKYDGKTILWLADAHPSVVVESLKSLGYSNINPLECDYVKIAHHGSLGNNSSELYQMIKCQRYILSSDGYNLHGLPMKACLAQIVTNPGRSINDHYSFYFTASDDVLRTIFEVDGDNVYKKFNFEIIYPIDGNGMSIQF